jgi:hypothetical protein
MGGGVFVKQKSNFTKCFERIPRSTHVFYDSDFEKMQPLSTRSFVFLSMGWGGDTNREAVRVIVSPPPAATENSTPLDYKLWFLSAGGRETD